MHFENNNIVLDEIKTLSVLKDDAKTESGKDKENQKSVTFNLSAGDQDDEWQNIEL